MYSLIHAWLCIMNPTDTGSASVLSDTRMAVYYESYRYRAVLVYSLIHAWLCIMNPTDTGSASVLSDTLHGCVL